jgi:hypothetical protein
MLGKVVGSVLAAPAIIAKEFEEAVKETEKVIDKAYDKLEK